jgi:hypothetical protein
MAASQSKRYAKKKQLTPRTKRSTKPKARKQKPRQRGSALDPAPGELALYEKTLSGRRFVEFPLVKGKIAEKVQLFTTSNANSLTIEF